MYLGGFFFFFCLSYLGFVEYLGSVNLQFLLNVNNFLVTISSNIFSVLSLLSWDSSYMYIRLFNINHKSGILGLLVFVFSSFSV